REGFLHSLNRVSGHPPGRRVGLSRPASLAAGPWPCRRRSVVMLRVRHWRTWQLWLAAVLLFLSPLSSRAQTSAAIVGAVTDEQGSAIPGVTVEVTSPALIERTKSTVTSADGTYQVVDLRPGEYSVTFSLEGFQAVRRTGITLSTG